MKKKISIRKAQEIVANNMYDVHKIPKGKSFMLIDDHGEITYESDKGMIAFAQWLNKMGAEA